MQKVFQFFSSAFSKKNDKPICIICESDQDNNFLILPCGHEIHKHCLYLEMKSFSEETFDKRIFKMKCKKCNLKTQIGKEYILQVFGKKTLQNWVKESSSPSMFTCGICLEPAKVDSSITLDCLHRYCMNCIKMFLHDKITDAVVSEEQLQCPTPKCKELINDHMIQYIVDKEYFDKFVKFRLKNRMEEEKENKKIKKSDFILRFCPLCDTPAEVKMKKSTFKCSNKTCRAKICTRCGVVHGKISCKKYRKKVESEKNDTEFKALNDKYKYTKCPKCGIVVEKNEGCNYMTCTSSKCKKKNISFCYLCGKKIKSYSHFERTGCYGNSCNTLDRIPE
jgi:hypothetical protein